MRKLFRNTGHTLVEVMVALFLTGIISIAGLRFYASVHNHTLTQGEIGDMQQAGRNNLQEIVRTLRKAGYKVGAHAPYRIAGDTLYVYYNDTQPIDTVAYYVDHSQQVSSSDGSPIPTGLLMKKVNSLYAEVYGDQIDSISFQALSASVVEITLTVGTMRPDEDFVDNEGVRNLTFTERVQIRNLNL
ncbi:prepilin-type N-terminal cleavage/methylation domain-containing protein [Candidatus Babeliales bacterium]|nr:prepilin-type N-terminal cleavage/methylation domain-containing protein [Candidatus Babeliales bacterium]